MSRTSRNVGAAGPSPRSEAPTGNLVRAWYDRSSTGTITPPSPQIRLSAGPRLRRPVAQAEQSRSTVAPDSTSGPSRRSAPDTELISYGDTLRRVWETTSSRAASPSRIRRLGLDPSVPPFLPRPRPRSASPPTAASQAWLVEFARQNRMPELDRDADGSGIRLPRSNHGRVGGADGSERHGDVAGAGNGQNAPSGRDHTRGDTPRPDDDEIRNPIEFRPDPLDILYNPPLDTMRRWDDEADNYWDGDDATTIYPARATGAGSSLNGIPLGLGRRGRDQDDNHDEDENGDAERGARQRRRLRPSRPPPQGMEPSLLDEREALFGAWYTRYPTPPAVPVPAAAADPGDGIGADTSVADLGITVPGSGPSAGGVDLFQPLSFGPGPMAGPRVREFTRASDQTRGVERDTRRDGIVFDFDDEQPEDSGDEEEDGGGYGVFRGVGYENVFPDW